MARSHPTRAAAPPRRSDAWWLVVIVYSALLLRGYVPFGNVFGGEEVAFQGNDAWYHLRLIDHLVENFPHRMTFDPYAIHPGGAEIGVAPLFDYLVAVPALIAGLGSPSPATVERIAAWLPPVLAALTALALYGVGRRVFDRRTGLLAAALLAFQPGQFLLRSLLGFADHHVAEALFSTLAVWLLLVALDRARGASGGDVEAGAGLRSRSALARRWPGLGAAALAGVALAAYLASWGGGALFVAVLALWAAAQRCLDHLLGRPGLYLVRAVVPAAAVALALLAPFAAVVPRATLHAAALVGLGTAPAVLEGLSRLAVRARLPRPLFPVAAAALAAAGGLALRLAWPGAAVLAAEQIARFGSSHLARTVAEARPLLSGSAAFAWLEVWGQYRTALALGIAGLALLLWRSVRERARPGQTLVAVWTLAMIGATLSQNRFGYYLDVNLALMVGFLCSTVLGAGGVPAARGRWWTRRWVRIAVASALAAAALLPTLRPVLDVARMQRAPGPEWRAALGWLREETPEPLGDPGAYLARYGRPTEEHAYRYPPDAYGVLAWWDYGYWIVRLGRRIPTANPTQAGAGTAARFFTATDEESALAVLDGTGARYVIANAELGLWPTMDGGAFGLFEQLTVWAGQPLERYFEVYWEPDAAGGALQPSAFFYPDFYRAMAIRMLLGGGEAVLATSASWAISWDERTGPEGEPVKVVVEAWPFPDAQQAQAFLDARPAGERWRLAGRDPRFPCVPVPPLERLERVFPTGELAPGLPAVAVFELAQPSS